MGATDATRRGGGPAFDIPPVAGVVLDEGGTIVSWSLAAEDIMGYSAGEVLGRPGTALLCEDRDRAAIRGAVAPWRPDADWGGVLAVRHRDGRCVEVGVRVFSATSPDGTPQWQLVVFDMARTRWLGHLPSQAPVGMAVVDTDLRCVWVNDALVRTSGVPREERLGRRMSEVLPDLPTEEIEAEMRGVLETGVPVIDHEYRGRTRAVPVREGAFSTSFFRLDDSAGRVLGLCYLVIDVTERQRARQRLALLNAASVRIGSSLDVMRTAQELADVAVPALADFVVVDLLASVLEGEEPPAGPVGHHVPLIRAGQQSVRPGCPEAVATTGALVSYPPTAPVRKALIGGRASLEAEIDKDARWLDADPARAHVVRTFGLHSGLVIPVKARGVTMGAATFARWQRPEPFEHDDLVMAEEFVAQAAVCIDNARRYTREHLAALTLQRSLLPPGLSEPDAAEVAYRYLPADRRGGVGGDWFDVIPLSGARVALVVGDVAGHGMHAAAGMGRLRAAVHTLADLDMPPDELLAHLDDLAIRLCDEETTGGVAADLAVLGATCLYAVYDPVSRRCVIARAGHPAPVIVAPDGSVDLPPLPAGPPLGLGGLPFESIDLELPEGSLLALYTNGLLQTEAGTDVDLRLDRLSKALSRARSERRLEDVCTAVVDSMLPDRRPYDDVALLLARTRVLGGDQVASCDLNVDPAVVADARAFTARQLAHWQLEEAAFTSELVVSELVTNAIRHATGPIRLRLIRDHTLICEVSDGSSTSPRLRHARTTDEGGRGLFLVAQLTQRWGTRYTSEGKTIWAEQSPIGVGALF